MLRSCKDRHWLLLMRGEHRERPYRVLFLCTGNSARSIMGESILNKVGEGRFVACSAGSYPTGEVKPMALELLNRLDFPTEGLRSKSWDEFTTPGAPKFDLVITVCDNAANEVCPVWPGHPMTVHWGIPDPAAVRDDDAAHAFRDAFRRLQRRIEALATLPVGNLDRSSLKKHLDEIGKAA